MTEPSAEAVELEIPVVQIDFDGRAMFAKMPTPEQLLVWRRVLKSIQALESGEWTGVELMNSLERGRKLIDSLLVDRRDVEWLDDVMLDGTHGLPSVARIIQMTVDAFEQKAAEEGNRQERRAAKKTTAKKATRRKAS